MRYIFLLLMLFSLKGFSQWKDFKVTEKGDTLNRIDQQDRKQGEWLIHYDNLRGEPGYEEEGQFLNNRKEGEWRLFNLMSDLIGIEHYRWGFKDGVCQYFNTNGDLRVEQSWKALNPDKAYDTLMVEDVDKLNSFSEVIIKNEGASLKHGQWKFYDAVTGSVVKTENYVLGKLEQGATQPVASATEKKAAAKPKEVLDFEKKNSGKKKVRYKDGTTN
ncbi:MAG: hypothetical protein ABI687_05665 [Flavitalea sp.]